VFARAEADPHPLIHHVPPATPGARTGGPGDGRTACERIPARHAGSKAPWVTLPEVAFLPSGGPLTNLCVGLIGGGLGALIARGAHPAHSTA